MTRTAGCPVVSIVIISKDEPALARTLAAVERETVAENGDVETLVVDASAGRLEHIHRRYPRARWIDYVRPRGVRISIPHQRNEGVRRARGQTIVFVDAGCIPRPGWLDALLAPIRSGEEQVAAGIAPSPNDVRGLYDEAIHEGARERYLCECPTINLAFGREVFESLDGFDESFEYGSDIDFSWRMVEAGYRIRSVPGAVVEHDWGGARRQLQRAYAYGKARARLYGKHPRRLARAWRQDPMVLVYPAFLLGLPLTARFPLYPALLVVPAIRNRRQGALRVLSDHLAYGAGVLIQVARR